MRSMFLNSISLCAILPLFMADGEGAGGAPADPSAAPITNIPATIDVSGKLPTLKQFDENAPAEFGNAYLESLLKVTDFDESLQQAQNAVEDTKKFVHFEMTKAVMSASVKGKDINLYAVFEGAKPVEKLNSKVLQYFGIIKREIVDEEVETTWTSKAMEEMYNYAGVDKEKDENEYNKRFNNRKRLNMRLSEAFKAACALMDMGVASTQLKLVENATTKAIEPIIENAPAALRGDTTKNGPNITFGKRTANEGATVAANISALTKAASDAHKKTDVNETGTGDRADKGGDRSGDAKLGMSDEDFGGLVNNLRRAVSAQEGKLSSEMVRQLQALVPFLDENIKAALAAPKTEADLDAPVVPPANVSGQQGQTAQLAQNQKGRGPNPGETQKQKPKTEA